MRSYGLSELAALAGVSRSSLSRWINKWDREALDALGCPKGTKKYNGKAVAYLAER